nr:uncharacterized protein LOC129057753 [Pongo abelii]
MEGQFLYSEGKVPMEAMDSFMTKWAGLFVCLRIPAMLPSVALPPGTVTVSPSSLVYMTLITLRSTGTCPVGTQPSGCEKPTTHGQAMGRCSS